MEKTFGSFIYKKRTQKHISLRGLAKMIDVSPVYVSSMERGKRAAPTYPVLMKIANALILSEEEKTVMFDLAAKSKKSLSLAEDLLEYINGNEIVHKALRTAKKCNATDEDWQNFIDSISEK
ncbi:helix-turn-helix domain-containing protein [uncultured Ruminococcus sp.]|uniref:helix-turn-helix domain-containing protein n=1 Tax=uncultured Ruminococcus sp. TaxID=165186 RepID=UPI0026012B4B|nr:helix-turn-helix transcriptional regulator [uncultured Ruminococcus sp.]